MLLSYLELMVMFTLLLGGVTGLLNYLGGSTLYLILRLALQGAFKIQIVQWCSAGLDRTHNVPSHRGHMSSSNNIDRSYLTAGSIKVRGLSWSPHLQARKVSLVQPARLGGHTIFTCDTVVIDTSLWHVLTGRSLGHSLHKLHEL